MSLYPFIHNADIFRCIVSYSKLERNDGVYGNMKYLACYIERRLLLTEIMTAAFWLLLGAPRGIERRRNWRSYTICSDIRGEPHLK